MSVNDAEVEESILADFDIHLKSIENILKPFIKQVSLWLGSVNQINIVLA